MKNVGYKRARHQFGLKYVQMCILGKYSTTCKQWLYKGDGIRGFFPPPPFPPLISFISQTLACYHVSDISICSKFSSTEYVSHCNQKKLNFGKVKVQHLKLTSSSRC